MKIQPPTRRQLLQFGLGGALLAACGGGGRKPSRDATVVAPTPGVIDDDDAPPTDAGTTCALTADNIEGPYYTAGAPYNDALAGAKDAGVRLLLGGLVVGVDCAPLRDVELDIWHADASGGYDNTGYHLRGKVATDAAGRWAVSTIIPGRYLNGRQYRPAHLHFKLRAAGHRELTTQLYFDGDPYNDVDPFLHRSLIMPVDTLSGASRCSFDFVLAEG